MRESVAHQPKSGDLFLFPSGLMHMVEPNTTQKDRYSISFNLEVDKRFLQIKPDKRLIRENVDFIYEIDAEGEVIS